MSSASTTITSYLKLAVPGNKNGNLDHISLQENVLIKHLCDQYEVKIDGERVKVSSECEDPFYETTFQIKSVKGFTNFFLNVMNILYEISKTINDCSLKGSVILQHLALFDERIVCSKKDIRTNAIMFGNIWDNQFIKHWEVWYKRKDEFVHEQMQFNTIKTHFEFDKNWAVVVEFYTKEQPEVGINVPFWNSRYQILIDGDTIRQIIVDLTHELPRIYFLLKSPVVVKRGIRDRGHPNILNRILDLPRGSGSQLRSHIKDLTENRIFCLEFFRHNLTTETLNTIISRFRCRFNIPVEFASLSDYANLNGFARYKYFSQNPCHYDELNFERYLENLFPIPRNVTDRKTWKIADRALNRRFSYNYLLEALLSRGSCVKDQLLFDQNNWDKLLQIIKEHINDDIGNDIWERHNLCESALEDLLNHVDNQPRIGNLLDVFKRLCLKRKESGESSQLTMTDWKQGMRRIRKVLLTPTRKIFLIPEMMMSNRAINDGDHDNTRIIRATFRDDNFGKMRFHSLRDLLEEKTMKRLEKGFSIMGRFFSYLASSNSQMRDGGAYFMERYSKTHIKEVQTGKIEWRLLIRKHWLDCFNRGRLDPRFYKNTFKPKIIDYRKKLGKFEMTGSIPKAMARLGQCFTQARACEGVDLGIQNYQMIPDVIGGKDPKGNPYMFTDGVGMISVSLAKEIAKSQGHPKGSVPSAYQFRFRGLKGMLVMDPGLDELAEHFLEAHRKGLMRNEKNEEIDLAPYTYKCLFRDSQLKFFATASGKDKWPIEIVKHSCPTPVTLNRPFINILDQVSAQQSLECHKRVCGRIEELLNFEMDSFSKYIVNEEKCRGKLESMPRRIHFGSLEQKFGFNLATEPFARSLIKAAIDVSMTKLLRKVNIPIPPSVGRSMFGVTDETRQLQYGQVFVQYTENVNTKNPTDEDSRILTGPLMITKFPTMCEGDVRMYEAVDIPELHHLHNVVVFPQSGPRSQPDEMAGSDLDGDEYAVIWDPLLFFEKNENAFGYCSDKPQEKFTLEEMDQKMNQFFAKFMKQEDVGVIATNHLHQSDQFGINSDVCQVLAEKNAIMLDYSKSGVAPDALTNRWFQNPNTGAWEPPEKSERKPDFSNNRFSMNTIYQSSRLLGILHRELRSVNDVVCSSNEKEVPISLDGLLIWKDYENYVPRAKEQLNKYNGQLRSIMDTFGVNTEAEVFSGSYREIRNRQSDKEEDNMSMYSTETVIEAQVTSLYRKFREEFFEEFAHSIPDGPTPGYRLTQPENEKVWEENDILRRVCRFPTDKMMAKAVAYYRTCYEYAMETRDRKLSFAWIAYDILNVVRSKKLLETGDFSMPCLPQFKAISDHRATYIAEAKQRNEFRKFLDILNPRDYNQKEWNQELHARRIIYKYVIKNLKLHECLFIIDAWARAKGLLYDESDLKTAEPDKKEEILRSLSENRLKWYHLALMVIMVATNRLGSLIDENQGQIGTKIFEFIDPNPAEQAANPKLAESSLDRLTLSFFRYLSSRDFRRLRCLNFAPIGLQTTFLRGEWIPFHTAASQTYYNLLLNLRFDELPISTEPVSERQNLIKEGDPFIVEIPEGVNFQKILDRLRKISKCVEIQGRVLSERKDGPVLLVSCRGTTEAINELRDLTSVKLPRYLWQMNVNITNPKRFSHELTHLFHYKVMGEVWNQSISHQIHRTHSDSPNQRNGNHRRGGGSRRGNRHPMHVRQSY